MNNKKNNLKVHFVSDSPLSKLTFGKWKQNGNSLKPDSSLHGTKEDRVSAERYVICSVAKVHCHLPKLQLMKDQNAA